MKIAICSSSMHTGNLVRGVGAYTRELYTSLQNIFPKDKFIISKDAKNIDLVHYPYFDPFSLDLPARYNVPTIITIHDLIPLKYPAHFPVGYRGRVAWLWQKLRAQRASAIITDSNSSARDIYRIMSIPEKRIHIIPLAPATARTSYALSPKLKKLYSLPEKYVLYVGDINWNKNVPGLVKAFSTLPKTYHLVLVGKVFADAPDIPEYRALQAAIAATSSASRIHTLGYVPSHHLGAIYHAATLYVQPSFDEGFGLPILEAMKAGCPVICSKAGSLPEVGGDAVHYFDPRKNELSTVLKTVLNSPAIRESLITAGLIQVKKFSWRQTAQLTHQVYEQLLQ